MVSLIHRKAVRRGRPFITPTTRERTTLAGSGQARRGRAGQFAADPSRPHSAARAEESGREEKEEDRLEKWRDGHGPTPSQPPPCPLLTLPASTLPSHSLLLPRWPFPASARTFLSWITKEGDSFIFELIARVLKHALAGAHPLPLPSLALPAPRRCTRLRRTRGEAARRAARCPCQSTARLYFFLWLYILLSPVGMEGKITQSKHL